MMSEKQVQKFHTDKVPGDASSEWDFCVRVSDVNSQGNQSGIAKRQLFLRLVSYFTSPLCIINGQFNIVVLSRAHLSQTGLGRIVS